MANLQIRNKREDARGRGELDLYTVRGTRYLADGWSEEMDLFRIWSAGESAAREQAEQYARHGVGGAATHGCETVHGVIAK